MGSGTPQHQRPLVHNLHSGRRCRLPASRNRHALRLTCPAVNHRMFVLESSSDDPWNSDYAFKGQLDTYDQFAMDGTSFQHSSGLYHVYSCWYEAYVSWLSMLCVTRRELHVVLFPPMADKMYSIKSTDCVFKLERASHNICPNEPLGKRLHTAGASLSAFHLTRVHNS
jgi:hypothetical protein